MTLFKQAALMLSLFLLIILATVLILNFQSANKGVQDRLYDDAKNTAASLSLSLGSANGDLSMMATMINANFDSGNYNLISLVDVENKMIHDRIMESDITAVPKWFISLIELQAPIAHANVSAGWSQVGILNVQSDTTYAYKQLYAILIDLLISFIIIALVGLATLNLLLHAILKPLKEVQKQAGAITKNEFIIQSKIPYTKELADVVLGMNAMVLKVKAMFNKENEELKAHKELEYIDQDTQLRNRKYLIDRLPAYLKADASYEGGVNMLISLSGIIEANEKLGRQNVNNIFTEIADIFRESTKNIKDSIIARINGTEFSLLLPNFSNEEAMELAKKIKQSCKDVIEWAELDPNDTFASIGLYQYRHSDTIAKLLSRSDNALAQAKFNHENIHLEKAENAIEVMGKEAWKLLINKAIEKDRFSFVSWSVIDTKAKKLSHNVLSINLTLDKNSSYSYAQFMAPAIQTGLSCNIYKKIVDMLFRNSSMVLSASTYSLRLPHEYLEHKDTYANLSELLRANAALLSFKVIIELPDKLVRQDSKLIREYIELFRKYGISIGIFEFIGESNDYSYLQELRPVYIKGESSYFLTQSDQSLSALRLITDTLGISLIAVGVADMEALEKLKARDIHVVQGKVTEILDI
ncbi:MAG: LapD/MoxY N-terminal periplasmic domain-containing protein [Sulfurimonas sp.]|jgi:diguanylate cyclase (GGDEF)-like protein